MTINAKGKYLGLFSSEEDAASAYDLAAKALYGAFAHLNNTELVKNHGF